MYITTLNGKKIDPLNLNEEENNVSIEQVATVLSHTCRFGGYLKEYYSVATHSVYCSYLIQKYVDPHLSSDYGLAALLHEVGGEGVLGLDFPSPVKKCFNVFSYGKQRTISDFEKISTKILLKSWNLYNIYPLINTDIMKRVDLEVMEVESLQLKGFSCGIDISHLNNFHLIPRSPKNSKLQFMERFHQLTSSRNEKASKTTKAIAQ